MSKYSQNKLKKPEKYHLLKRFISIYFMRLVEKAQKTGVFCNGNFRYYLNILINHVKTQKSQTSNHLKNKALI